MFMITGGNESLGPPVGGVIPAHPVPVETIENPIAQAASAVSK
jgi:hypothetical protein